MDKWQNSDMLANGLASTFMHMKRFEEAEKVLSESRADRPASTDTLVNLAVCSLQLRRPQEVVDQLLADIKTQAPNHPWLASHASVSSAFDRVAERFSPANA